MKVVVQRSKKSSVEVDNVVVGSIDKGLVVLVGFTHGDDIHDIEYLVDKIINLRIFDDENGVMNKSILDVNGSILSISQFTLYADTLKGRRPSYVNALKNIEAKPLYDLFNEKLREKIKVETGIFGSDMKVAITNDGPVTIIMESR
ncbi:MAG: D-aminoacyl-tRNA deacylase [Firmicutes bacterium]|nr:D-aminoacyl-tRNA deacylase [Bacillota bacterium]